MRHLSQSETQWVRQLEVVCSITQVHNAQSKIQMENALGGQQWGCIKGNIGPEVSDSGWAHCPDCAQN